ncbi:hypothetical protein BSKO_06175 [Bryopsis sp. KO-2023]|nr:hypothetical protein BSKO_06175 [Bryopsis sp. KO-2023]
MRAAGCTCRCQLSATLRQSVPVVTRRQSPRRLICGASPDDEGGKGTPPQSSTESSEPRPNPLDPVQTIQWGGTLPDRRRAIQGIAFSTFVALGGNLGGITSFLLGLDDGKFASKIKADIVVPVKGFKRCVDYSYGFEFRYPSYWLADQSLVLRAAERIERQNPLDLPSIREKRKRTSLEPVAAFGPPGTTGEENVSVVVAPIAPGFTLASLGNPEEAGQKLLDTVIAPEGSGKNATLLSAEQRIDENQQAYYTLEYTVRTQAWYRHNISVYAVKSDSLFSLNAQCPESEWLQDGDMLKATAAGFGFI